MAKLVRQKLEGSTLIEVLIAMVIIMVIFTIAMQVFSNVMHTGVSFNKIKVQNQIIELTQEVKTSGMIKEELLTVDSIVYELKILPTDQVGLSLLEISASQRGKKISGFNCLFINNGNGKD